VHCVVARPSGRIGDFDRAVPVWFRLYLAAVATGSAGG